MNTKEEKLFWMMAYCGVLSIRLHPKNDSQQGPNTTQACLDAKKAADMALQQFIMEQQKWPGSQE